MEADALIGALVVMVVLVVVGKIAKHALVAPEVAEVDVAVAMENALAAVLVVQEGAAQDVLHARGVRAVAMDALHVEITALVDALDALVDVVVIVKVDVALVALGVKVDVLIVVIPVVLGIVMEVVLLNYLELLYNK